MFRLSRKRFAVAGLPALCIASADRSRAAQIVFKFGSNAALDHPMAVRGKQMCAAIERESQGRLSMQYFPASQLGSDVAVLAQVRIGAVQIVSANIGTLSALVPTADIFNIGFAFADAEEAFRAADGPLGAYVRREAANKGLYFFETATDAGMVQIGSNTRPIHAPDDLRGFKVRTTASKIIVDFVKLFGAIPSPITANETYTALQTRVIDGETAPLTSIDANRWYEVNKYISLTNHGWSGVWDTANVDDWSRLPRDLQEIVERNHRKYTLLERRDIRILSGSVADKLTRRGLTVNAVDPKPFRALLGNYYKYWAGEFGSTVWSLFESSLRRSIA